ncbi:Hypothetical predicted protein [Marmota monax]|uniref:Uncharacterized protein n=1 Tax=Marmota monax TaxID=9995 RepID=A0A5E4CTS4_MARMO|nr:hypothetical protein GHT09_013706 [Marmota monax]VTJ85288.1 Hypothetical predicted protein [Marmota monax]
MLWRQVGPSQDLLGTDKAGRSSTLWLLLPQDGATEAVLGLHDLGSPRLTFHTKVAASTLPVCRLQLENALVLLECWGGRPDTARLPVAPLTCSSSPLLGREVRPSSVVQPLALPESSRR